MPARTSHQYKHPPIEEALVEFKFESGREWDPTLPGKLHQHPAIRPHYPGVPRTQKLFQAELQAKEGKAPAFAIQEGIGRIQLPDLENRWILSLGADVLSIHVLRPYVGWESFRPRIQETLTAYCEVSGTSSIVRVGVRYINKITIPKTQVELKDYFTIGPITIVNDLPETVSEFMSRIVYNYEDGSQLALLHATIPSPGDSAAFLLDIDVFKQISPSLDVPAAIALVDQLHDREGRAFESVITDKARSQFDAD